MKERDQISTIKQRKNRNFLKIFLQYRIACGIQKSARVTSITCNRINYFKNIFFKKLHGVHHTAVCIPPQIQVLQISPKKTQWCAFHLRVKLRDVHHNAESRSAMYIITQNQAPRCTSYRRVKLRGVGIVRLMFTYI